jgi:hypothetical protein
MAVDEHVGIASHGGRRVLVLLEDADFVGHGAIPEFSDPQSEVKDLRKSYWSEELET